MALVANVVRRNSGGDDGSTLHWPGQLSSSSRFLFEKRKM
jgi:hypothetical protein